MTRIGYLLLRLTLDEPGGVTISSDQIDSARIDVEPAAQVVLQRDAAGRPLLPPTSVAGSLRAHLRSLGPQIADTVMGTVPAPDAPPDARAVASPLSVLDTRAVGDLTVDSHTTTAIDDVRASAAASTLRAVETAAAQSSWDIYLSWLQPTDEQWTAVLPHLITWAPLLGRGTSTGRGRAHVSALRSGQLDLDRDDDLLTFLTVAGPALVEHAARRVQTVDLAPALPPVLLEVRCHITQALHIGTGDHDQSQPQRATVVSINGYPTVPATTTKGLFRSRMAYILRSLAVQPEPCRDRSCGTCLPCRVFGYSASGPARRQGATGARSRLRFGDSTITALNSSDPAAVSDRFHAPIDRFTGGIATQTVPPLVGASATGWEVKGLLHAENVVETGQFVLRIDELAPLGADRLVVIALLRLILADIDDGFVTLGRGGTRGFGRISVDDADAVMPMKHARAHLTAYVEEQASAS